jgi:hypothetical protein
MLAYQVFAIDLRLKKVVILARKSSGKLAQRIPSQSIQRIVSTISAYKLSPGVVIHLQAIMIENGDESEDRKLYIFFYRSSRLVWRRAVAFHKCMWRIYLFALELMSASLSIKGIE